MPIDSLPAGGPAARLTPGGPPSIRPGAPPGFSAALDDAAKTWTAPAEGQPATKPLDRAASATPRRSETAASTDGPVDDAVTDRGPSRADDGDDAVANPASVPATQDALAAPDATLTSDPRLTPALTVPVTTLPTPISAATAPAGVAADPAVAQTAGEIVAAAAQVAGGAPANAAAPGVAELLASLADGTTELGDLPADVQALVAKATAAQHAAAGAQGETAISGGTASGTSNAGAAPSTTVDASAANGKTAAGEAPLDGGASQQSSMAPAAPMAGATGETTPPAPPIGTAPVDAHTDPAATQSGTPVDSTTGDASAAGRPTGPSALALAIAAAHAAATPGASEATTVPVAQPGPSPVDAAAAIAGNGASDLGAGGGGNGAATADGSGNGGTGTAPVPTPSPAQAASGATTPAALAPTPASPAAPAPAAAPTVPVAMPGQQAAAIEALVHLSRHRGTSHARIALAPEQLGGIQVTLIFGADGVTARLIADRPEAAAALSRAGQDLRDTLGQQGIDLAGLETGFAGDGGRGASRDAATAEALRLSRGSSATPSSGNDPSDTALHVTLGDPAAPAPLAPGRTIDLRA